jgi:glycine cleavage system aminomethyltransferase T
MTFTFPSSCMPQNKHFCVVLFRKITCMKRVRWSAAGAVMQVEVLDVSAETALFTVAGPGSDDLVGRLGAGQLVGREDGEHAVFGSSGQPIVVCVARELVQPGYSLIASEAVAADLWRKILTLVSPARHAHVYILLQSLHILGSSGLSLMAAEKVSELFPGPQGAVPMGEGSWERARILAGRPAAGHELGQEYSPLEAALFSAISLNKASWPQQRLAKLTFHEL